MSASQVSLRTLLQSYGLWGVLLTIPLLVNGILWTSLVLPQQAALRAWHETQALTTLQPRLAGLLTESRQLIAQWERTGLTTHDPAVVMQTVQRLAGVHRVQLAELQTKGQQVKGLQRTTAATATPSAASAPAGFATLSLDLEVAGRFHNLARWLSALEAQSGMQIDSWTMTAGKGPRDPHQLTMSLTAFLRQT